MHFQRYNDQQKIMFVGGPNQRKDYHLEEGEELFYMIKGDMCLKVVEQGKHRDIPIKEGELFLLPGRIPHSPQRQSDTIGLVIERERTETEMDGLRYFVEKDGKPTMEPLFEKWFHCEDLGTQLGPIIKEFFASEQCKTGKSVPGTIPEKTPFEIDTSRKLEEPFLLSDWLTKNENEIETKGIKRVFGDGYQFTVDVLGPGEEQESWDGGEIWLWQLHGESTAVVDGTKYKLKVQDSLRIPPNTQYSIVRGAGSKLMKVIQDPRRK
ncbi:3-hydroxyanthranilate 3,4-dioxygenase isoform X2 [Lingula anatina]|uniref:3-hydroxyanthranilate 3,4-dioxygenase n=1 Tax=Lingula anatina TaxID=7574 RepID=A0A1S3H653_LINAN|nr:3-hydroxyanthranilate 3,4-dioxygenase isoform X2 [Lingula anatina]|eukprot:XP_013380956.1 3-hydroxyanthranilate 3,4-dioxygenase isoform X2 [Lingula anatina]